MNDTYLYKQSYFCNKVSVVRTSTTVPILFFMIFYPISMYDGKVLPYHAII